jgi:hypothetical protein
VTAPYVFRLMTADVPQHEIVTPDGPALLMVRNA